MNNMDIVRAVDPQIAEAMQKELSRQRDHIELIASENFVSPAVMAAMGTHLTNKYAEGVPGKRYYGGCKYVDIVEEIARKRACELFGAEHANVQPHAGVSANLAVYFAMLQPGDTILGMNLAHGGHLTHGSPASLSGKYYHAVSYGVDPETEQIDYDELMHIAKECRPKIIVAGASAYSRTLDFSAFRRVADEVGAYLMVDIAHIAGLVAAGEHPNPVPYADFVTSTTHKTLRGPRGGMILCRKEYANKIDSAVFPGLQGGPLMHIIAAKAVCLLEATQESFRADQRQTVINAKALAAQLTKGGLRIVSGGTDNHLMLVDLSVVGKTGKQVEKWLDAAHITANKNTIPFEKAGVSVASGVRFGTPSVTTRGMKEAEMEIIGKGICTIIDQGEKSIEAVGDEMRSLCARYPIYE